jgi:hypothetical protein
VLIQSCCESKHVTCHDSRVPHTPRVHLGLARLYLPRIFISPKNLNLLFDQFRDR